MFIRHVGRMTNRAISLAAKNTLNVKQVNDIATVTAVNVDTLTLILKYVYKNATDIEKMELQELGKRYGEIDFENVSKA